MNPKGAPPREAAARGHAALLITPSANRYVAKGVAGVRALDTEPTGTEHTASAQEVWWALEDLWLRLSASGLLAVEVEAGSTAVVIRHFRNAEAAVVGELRTAALDADTYQSREGGRVRSFIRTLEFRGNDLVCELNSAAAIGRWPDGESLALQVRAFMTRLAMAGRQTAGGEDRP